EPSVIVIVKEFAGPSPSGIVCAGFARDVSEGEIAIVVPEKISLAHVIVSDVGHVDVEEAVIVKVAPIGVHSFFGVKADGGFRLVSESAVAVIHEETVGSKFIGHVQIFPASIVCSGMAHI